MNRKDKKFCGLLLAFLVLSSLALWIMCSDKHSPNAPSDDETYLETPALAAFSDSLIVAFQSENKGRVLALADPEYLAVCDDELDGTRTTMTAVGEALEKRKLMFASDLYAEFEVTINGEKFSIAYGNCGDGRWQLMRF